LFVLVDLWDPRSVGMLHAITADAGQPEPSPPPENAAASVALYRTERVLHLASNAVAFMYGVCVTQVFELRVLQALGSA
jgi:hypothetical protein